MRRLLIGILAVIAVVAIYFALQNKDEGTISQEEVEFAVDDPSVIDRVSMRDRNGKYVDLSLKAGKWYVNDEYLAFQPFIDQFLSKTLSKIVVKGPVAETAKENVIRGMVAESIKVDIYNKGSLLRSYYVGSYTPDMKGTYMHIKGSQTPYITYIPGFEGYLSPKYNLNKENWYDRAVFDLPSEEIERIELTHYQEADASFALSRKGSGFQITPAVAGFSQQAARSYFALFSFKNFEGYADYLNQAVKDSVLKSDPLMKLKLYRTTGEPIELVIYEKGNENKNTLQDKNGNVLTYDPERYFASFSGFPHLVTIQKYTFGKILAKRTDFAK